MTNYKIFNYNITQLMKDLHCTWLPARRYIRIQAGWRGGRRFEV